MGIRRFVLIGAVALLSLTGCAEAGARPGSTPHTTAIAMAPPPGKDTLPCTKGAADPSRTATAAGVAEPPDESPLPEPSNAYLDENYRGEMLRRQMAANRAYLDRRPLPEAAVPGAVKCALAAEDALRALAEKKTYDIPSVQMVLAAKGLPGANVREPGSRDRGYGDGLVIASWTGQACVLGQLSPKYGYHVEYGSQIADGGCLPAAD